MLRVKASVKPSRIEGLGLFAEERIPKGTVLWSFDPFLDQRFWPGEVARMSDGARAFLARYAYCDRGTLVLCGDHARFMNHSPEANCGSDVTRTLTVAQRDIEAGEELTDDYSTMEDPWAEFAGLIEPELTPEACAPH